MDNQDKDHYIYVYIYTYMIFITEGFFEEDVSRNVQNVFL